MRKTINILILTAIATLLAMPSCERKVEGFDGYERNMKLANMALDRADTALARLFVDSAETYAVGFSKRNELLAYNILLDPHLSQINLRGIITALDSARDRGETDGRIRMRILELYASQLEREHSKEEAQIALASASALAYSLDEGQSYVRINVRIHKQTEDLGNYVDAVKAYKQLLDYSRKCGLRSSEMLVLYRLVNAFLSMGDLPTAQIYQGEMAMVGDTSATAQCLRHLSAARISISLSDTVALRQALQTSLAQYKRDTIACKPLELTYRSMCAYYSLLTNKVDEAASLVDEIYDQLSVPNLLTFKYADIIKIQILLKQGKMFEAKVMLDALDAAGLRTKNVEMYEQYTEAVSQYYSRIGDERMAYYFLKQKTLLIDTLKKQANYHDLAYRSMELRRDTTIISQGALLEQMTDKQHRLEFLRTIWGVVAVVIIAEAIGLYFFISIRRIKKRRHELENAYGAMAEEIKRKKELLQTQKEQLDERNEALASELMFANHIQSNILQPEDMLDTRGIDGHFIIFSPCNMVSGDFYWFFDCGDKLFVCVADATGHGIPGAFISMVASTLLSDIAADPTMREPSVLVEKLSDEFVRVIRSNTDIANKDSLDLSLFCLDRVAGKVSLCLSRQTAYIVHSDGRLEILSGVKRSVGESCSLGGGRPFVTTDVQLGRGDCVYLTTDGFVSQFGGQHNHKFKRTRLAEMLLENYQQRMSIQRDAIVRRFDDWRGENDQTDDVLMIGLKMGDLKSSRFSRFNSNPYHFASGSEENTEFEIPDDVVANVKTLLADIARKVENAPDDTKLVDVLSLFGECYIEWIDSKVRVSPAESEWPSFALAEITTIGNFTDFSELVTKVVVTVPVWAKDLQWPDAKVSTSFEVEKETVRITFVPKK